MNSSFVCTETVCFMITFGLSDDWINSNTKGKAYQKTPLQRSEIKLESVAKYQGHNISIQFVLFTLITLIIVRKS